MRWGRRGQLPPMTSSCISNSNFPTLRMELFAYKNTSGRLDVGNVLFTILCNLLLLVIKLEQHITFLHLFHILFHVVPYATYSGSCFLIKYSIYNFFFKSMSEFIVSSPHEFIFHMVFNSLELTMIFCVTQPPSPQPPLML